MSTSSQGAGAEVRFGRAVLLAGACWFALEGLFAYHMDRHRNLLIGIGVAALLLLVLRAVGGAARTQVALVLVPLLAAFHGFEWYLSKRKPGAADVAAAAGRPWDNRSQADVVDDLVAAGRPAVPNVPPKSVLLLENGPIKAPDGDLAPVNAISNATTVFCNEGGQWAQYESDEHGLPNPRGAWSAQPMHLGLVGDSFTQGACVSQTVSWVESLRKAGHPLVNTAMSGNGPLFELAATREFLSRVKPRHVLWLYFRNDPQDLSVEKAIPLFRRYLDEPDFRQGLFDKQPLIDQSVRALVQRKASYAPRWPRALAGVGLTRTSTPVWLQDLVMAEDRTSTAAILRLDRIADMLSNRAAAEPFDVELFERILKQAKSEVAAWGGTLHFVYLPDLWYLGNKRKDHPDRTKVLEAVRRAELPLLDAHVPFEQQPDLEALRYHPLAHYSPLGNEVVARVIGDYVAKLTF